MQQSIFLDDYAGAVFDKSGRYRYSLWRIWDESLSACTFVMLNPSTANETNNDPTVARCINYAKAWGYGKLNVRNIFAYRSTDPRELLKVVDPIGPDNDKHILEAVLESKLIVAAWGTWGRLLKRGHEVLKIIEPYADIHCLGTTMDGFPKHPLYLKKDKLPELIRVLSV